MTQSGTAQHDSSGWSRVPRSRPIDTLEKRRPWCWKVQANSAVSPFGPGDYQRAHSGSLHPSYITKEGCVFLLFSGTEYEFLPDRPGQSSSEQFLTIRTGIRRMATGVPGVDIQTLFSESKTVEATSLLRLSAGGVLAASELSFSEAYVLAGSARLGLAQLSTGDYLQTMRDGQIGELQSQLGCTLLIRSAST